MKTLTAVLSIVFIPVGFALAQTDSWPIRTDDNIIVAAYNIQWLGNMNHDLEKLSEVIQHFDVCGIVEVKKEPRLRELVAALESKTGADWGYVFGLRTHRPSGNYHEAGAAVAPTERINAARLGVIGPWREWPAEDCREIERICQPLMGEYGYGNEPEWRARL